MKDNISPEEKLLRLIKGEKKNPPAYFPDQGAPLDKIITSEITNAKQNSHNVPAASANYFSTSNVRKLMFGLALLVFIYLITSFVYPWVGLKKIILPKEPNESKDIEEIKSKPQEIAKPYEFYLQGLGQRQIFASSFGGGGEDAIAATGVDSIKDLNLVGIISGDNPQAVIEDRKTQKSYSLSKGQSFGEFQVEDIQEGKLILNYRGQRYELYL